MCRFAAAILRAGPENVALRVGVRAGQRQRRLRGRTGVLGRDGDRRCIAGTRDSDSGNVRAAGEHITSRGRIGRNGRVRLTGLGNGQCQPPPQQQPAGWRREEQVSDPILQDGSMILLCPVRLFFLMEKKKFFQEKKWTLLLPRRV